MIYYIIFDIFQYKVLAIFVYFLERKNEKNIFGILILIVSNMFAQAEYEKIELPDPQRTGGRPLMEVLNDRQSTREFRSEEISIQMILNMLWAAFGINRAETGRRTAPSAHDGREINIYMATSEGLFLFDPDQHCLFKIFSDDIREFTGKQDFTQKAPVNLIYVVDYDKMMMGSYEEKKFYALADLGFISQNVYLFCSSERLVTIVLAWIDHEILKEKMNLPENSEILLSQPVGYPVIEE